MYSVRLRSSLMSLHVDYLVFFQPPFIEENHLTTLRSPLTLEPHFTLFDHLDVGSFFYVSNLFWLL